MREHCQIRTCLQRNRNRERRAAAKWKLAETLALLSEADPAGNHPLVIKVKNDDRGHCPRRSRKKAANQMPLAPPRLR